MHDGVFCDTQIVFCIGSSFRPALAWGKINVLFCQTFSILDGI